MSKKPIDTTHLQNELEGASLFFPTQGKQPASQPISQQESKPASTLASTANDIIARVRKTVRSTGKEVSFVRLSPEEKRLLADIVYTYKRQGVKTSENEINRIAINYLLEDYQDNGQNSILAQVIEALLA